MAAFNLDDRYRFLGDMTTAAKTDGAGHAIETVNLGQRLADGVRRRRIGAPDCLGEQIDRVVTQRGEGIRLVAAISCVVSLTEVPYPAVRTFVSQVDMGGIKYILYFRISYRSLRLNLSSASI